MPADVAADSYHRYKEDVAVAKALGVSPSPSVSASGRHLHLRQLRLGERYMEGRGRRQEVLQSRVESGGAQCSALRLPIFSSLALLFALPITFRSNLATPVIAI